jgi:hypothetical protein
MDVPYGVISDCFKAQTVVPFLGAAASFVGASEETALPGGRELAKTLAEKSAYPGNFTDPLSKVAQFLEEIAADRDFLLSHISTTFHDDIDNDYQTSLTDFLTQLPIKAVPKLIITTNYDILVERALEKRNAPYLAIFHIMRGTKFAGRLACYESLTLPMEILTRTQLETRLQESEEQDTHRILIYKMHGTSKMASESGVLDSVVVTETDYVDFLAADMLKKIPTKIVQLLRDARLLFLGYSLEDWNFRVLLQRLHKIQKQGGLEGRRHWAFLKDPDPVETRFWEKRGVNLYPLSLDIFLSNLVQKIQTDLA